MKRDMDLVRAIVLKLETWESRPGAVMQEIDRDFPIPEYKSDEIRYHRLISEKGWFGTTGGPDACRNLVFRRLTFEGHDFADAVRDDRIWAMTKAGALNARGFTLNLLSQLAKGLAKNRLKNILIFLSEYEPKISG